MQTKNWHAKQIRSVVTHTMGHTLVHKVCRVFHQKQRKLDVIKFEINKVGDKLIKIAFQLYGFVRYLTTYLNQPHYHT